MQTVVVTIHSAIGLIDRDRLARERSKQKPEDAGERRAVGSAKAVSSASRQGTLGQSYTADYFAFRNDDAAVRDLMIVEGTAAYNWRC
jgi:hypothetical protein